MAKEDGDNTFAAFHESQKADFLSSLPENALYRTDPEAAYKMFDDLLASPNTVSYLGERPGPDAPSQEMAEYMSRVMLMFGRMSAEAEAEARGELATEEEVSEVQDEMRAYIVEGRPEVVQRFEVDLREYYHVSDSRPWLLRDASLRGELKLAETSRAEKSGHKTPFLGTTALELRFRELYGIEAVCMPRYRHVLRTRCACGSGKLARECCVPSACEGCGRTGSEDGKKLKLCSGCRSTLWCGRACQRAHWHSHKAQCRAMRLATGLPDATRLLETLLYSPSPGFFLLEEHLRRVLTSAKELGWSVAAAARAPILAALDREAKAWPDDEAGRVRVILARDGGVTVERVALPLGPHPLVELLPAPGSVVRVVVLDSSPTLRNDLTLRHKCTYRPRYDAARARNAVGSGHFDVLMFNEDEELTECSIANVALEVGDGLWRTPPLECGLLGGVMRGALLRAGSGGGAGVAVSPEAWRLEEGVVTLQDLRAALRDGRRLVAFNSVRGAYWMRVLLER